MTDARGQTEWTAVFLAAGELSRRGYQVSFTIGQNAPLADLVVRSPGGTAFMIDVKGKAKPGNWLVKPKTTTAGLFYVLVRIGRGQAGSDRSADRFYVLPQSDALRLTRHNADKPTLSGFPTMAVNPFLDGWAHLPA